MTKGGAGYGEETRRCCAQDSWHCCVQVSCPGDVYHPPLLPRLHFVPELPSEIAVRRATRLATVEVMVKCCARKPGFYEACEQTFQHGTPGV